MSTRRHRRGLRLAAALIGVAMVGACSSRTALPPPGVVSIEPASGPATSVVDVSIRGKRFFAKVRRRLGSGTFVQSEFRAWLATDTLEFALEDVKWVSATELSARVPGVLPPGTYALRVEAPNGNAALPNAFTVVPIEDCATGVDDDGDGLVNCGDPDCIGRPCQDGDPCTDGDVCGDTGVCSGRVKPCTPPSSCFTGGCDAGTCAFSVLAGASCSDDNPCTAGDTCSPDGTCVGEPTCVPPGECWSAQCAPDGGCLLTVNTGRQCSTGTCREDGACASTGWSYAPSNVDPHVLAPSASAVFANCDAVFSTTSDSFVVGCPDVQPAVSTVTLADAREATVLAFRDLTIDGAASLTFIGEKPAIVVVFGNAAIHGRVLARSTATLEGAGSNGATCVGRAGGNSSSTRSGGGGAGHRTAGAPGGEGFGSVGGSGGIADPSPGPEPLRGGCPGGTSGQIAPVTGGRGGGALQVSASGTLLVSGVLSVSGAGGAGGPSDYSGGFGGGSGGTIVLEGEAIELTATARLTANAGAGGGGSGAGAARGSRGEDGSIDSDAPATGGSTGSSFAGRGGGGGAGSVDPAAGVPSINEGAGGGGASSGAIFVRASPGRCALSPQVVSPPAAYTNCP